MEQKDFFVYSWFVDTKQPEITLIRMYGIDEDGKNVCVSVKDFTPYIYIELPKEVDWNDKNVSVVKDKINDFLKDLKPVFYNLVYKKKLFFAHLKANKENKLEIEQFPFLLCAFNNEQSIRKLNFFFSKPLFVMGMKMNFKIHENNASPILQLTSLRKISTANWITFKGKRIEDGEKETYADFEYEVKWKQLSEKKTDKIVRPLLLGYDIEVYSSNPNAMPNADKNEDKIFQISCVFARQGSNPNTWIRYLLTLGKTNHTLLENENIKVLEYEQEFELLIGFVNLIKEFQPNIIIGYNIFTFDIPYTIKRAMTTLIFDKFSKQGMHKYNNAIKKTIEWSSSAYKNQNFEFLDAEGRIFVDLLPLIKRDYKLSNYKLKTISTHFLKDMTKDPLDAKAIFRCYLEGMKGGDKGKKALAIVGKYCVKDSELVVRLFETLTTWVALCEMSKVTNVPIFSLFTQGQQLKVFSQVYKKCTSDNIVVERNGYDCGDEERYVGATVFAPIPGIYEKVVPFDFNSLYPTSIIAKNIDYSTLVLDEKIPDRLCNVMEWEEHIGCHHDPKIIRKSQLDKIIMNGELEIKQWRNERDKRVNKDKKDFFKTNIDGLLLKLKPFREERSNIMKSMPKDLTCCKRKYRWLKEPIGVLPEILKNLLQSRADTKKEMKNIKEKMKEMKDKTCDEFYNLKTYCEVLDQRQNALKTSANSAYGSLGVRKGYLPFMPGAMCTTYVGRTAIEKASSTIKNEFKGELVYGDTDSNYVSFPGLNTAQECWDHSVDVAKKVSALFPKPMALAFEEKIYWKFLILTKKRYMSLACERDGNISSEILKKGVLLNRRDNSEFIRKVYENVVMQIFHKAELNDILYYIVTEINKLCCGFYSWKNFVITKAVGNTNNHAEKDRFIPKLTIDEDGKKCYKIGDYKVALLPDTKDQEKLEHKMKLKKAQNVTEYYIRCLPAQVQLALKMEERGNPVPPGTRLEYLITTQGGHTANQNIKIESSDYFSKHQSVLQIDYLYYLKQLANPLDQILDILYKNKQNQNKIFNGSFVLNQYKFRSKIRSKVVNEIKNMFSPKLIFS